MAEAPFSRGRVDDRRADLSGRGRRHQRKRVPQLRNGREWQSGGHDGSVIFDGILGPVRSYGGPRRDGAAPEVTAERRGVAELKHLGNVVVQVLPEVGL